MKTGLYLFAFLAVLATVMITQLPSTDLATEAVAAVSQVPTVLMDPISEMAAELTQEFAAELEQIMALNLEIELLRL